MMETADAQWVKSLVRQLTKCPELPILRNHSLGNMQEMRASYGFQIYYLKFCYQKLHTKYRLFTAKAYHLSVMHFAPLHSQYRSKERAAALSLRIFIYFHSLRTYWLAGCPVVMTDRSAEGPHCSELGQGVALFSLIVPILSLWLFSILTGSDCTTVKFLPFLSNLLTFAFYVPLFFLRLPSY